MGITTIQKGQTAVATTPAVTHKVMELSALELKVNEYVEIHTELSASGALEKVKRLDVLKKELAQYADEDKGAGEVILHGTQGNVIYGPRKNATVLREDVNLPAALGQPLFNTIATVGITALKATLTKTELDKITTTVLGSRSLKTVEATQDNKL